jgi:hypothetical protein
MSEPDPAKLSEASEQCGIPTDILNSWPQTADSPRSSEAEQVTSTFPATTSRPGVIASACSRTSATAIFGEPALLYAAWTPNSKRSAATSPRPASTLNKPLALTGSP